MAVRVVSLRSQVWCRPRQRRAFEDIALRDETEDTAAKVCACDEDAHVTAPDVALCVAAAHVVVVRRLAARMVRRATKQKTWRPRLHCARDEDTRVTAPDVALRVAAARVGVVVVRRLAARMACRATEDEAAKVA